MIEEKRMCFCYKEKGVVLLHCILNRDWFGNLELMDFGIFFSFVGIVCFEKDLMQDTDDVERNKCMTRTNTIIEINERRTNFCYEYFEAT